MSFLRMAAKQSPLNSRMRSGKRIFSGLKGQIGALRNDQLRRIGQPQHALLDEHALIAEIQLLHHETLQAGGHLTVDLEPDDIAAPPPLQGRLILRDEVFCFLLDFDVAVAQHAKCTLTAGKKAREQAGHEHADDRLDADEADRRVLLTGGRIVCGQADETRELARDRQQGMHGAGVALASQLEADCEAPVLNEREGVRRIEGDRCEDRQVAGQELLFEPCSLGRVQRLGFDNENARRCHLGLQSTPAGLLIADEGGCKSVDLGELLGGGQPVLACLYDAGIDLPIQARDPHHVEFIEVGSGYGQKPQALQHRVARVVRLLQDAAIELQPRQLAVEIARRTSRRCHGRRGLDRVFLFLQSGLGGAHG